METINLNNNQADCIKSQSLITGTRYNNICNGQKTFIPYGSLELLVLGLCVFIIGVFMLALYNE